MDYNRSIEQDFQQHKSRTYCQKNYFMRLYIGDDFRGLLPVIAADPEQQTINVLTTINLFGRALQQTDIYTSVFIHLKKRMCFCALYVFLNVCEAAN